MPRRRHSDILAQETAAFLARYTRANRRTSPAARRRAIVKRRLKKELKGIARDPLFFEHAHFGQVWKEHRAWTIERNAFDIDSFARQYEKTVKRLLTRELLSMHGEGASIKVLPVINFVLGDTHDAHSREDYADMISKGYAQPTWRRQSVLPQRVQYLGVDSFNLRYEEH